MDKPALLRRLFELACRYSGQVLSYTKMLGQLQDAGNATTLAHYLDLLASAGMVTGLQKYAGDAARSRGSSPKLQVLNTALLTATSGLVPAGAKADREFWGRSSNRPSARIWPMPRRRASASCSTGASAHRRWTSSCAPGARSAIEVKSGRTREARAGLATFGAAFRCKRQLLVGGDGIALEEFLSRPAGHWVRPA